ncbi:hypothetical protein D3C78_1742330 [compost metagenome]
MLRQPVVNPVDVQRFCLLNTQHRAQGHRHGAIGQRPQFGQVLRTGVAFGTLAGAGGVAFCGQFTGYLVPHLQNLRHARLAQVLA